MADHRYDRNAVAHAAEAAAQATEAGETAALRGLDADPLLEEFADSVAEGLTAVIQDHDVVESHLHIQHAFLRGVLVGHALRRQVTEGDAAAAALAAVQLSPARAARERTRPSASEQEAPRG